MALCLDHVVSELSKILHREDIPIIVWGEIAMRRYGIPTVILRVDVAIPDDMLTRTASALQAEGWIVPTGPLPRAIAGFWRSGWKEVAKTCLRFSFPPNVLTPDDDGDDIELLIFPTSFVGLGPCLSLDSGEYTRIDLLGPNVYLPSSHLMAKSIARTYDRHGEKCTGFALLLRAWASYFYLYCDFHAESLDDAEQEVRDFWHSISTT
ncbi:hypothetical protein ACEPAG_160 [Sanghuangporus baumii]